MNPVAHGVVGRLVLVGYAGWLVRLFGEGFAVDFGCILCGVVVMVVLGGFVYMVVVFVSGSGSGVRFVFDSGLVVVG